jgi:DNA-directed RNA polymerase subunit RPC12/RpoP
MAQMFIPVEQTINNECPKCENSIVEIGWGCNEEFPHDPDAIFGTWYKCNGCGVKLVKPDAQQPRTCPTC